MNGVTIRAACPDEVPALAQVTSEYVGTSYKWADRLGAGRTASESLALVAVDVDGCIHGAIGVTPVPASSTQIVWQRDPGTFDFGEVPWWKINVLAVNFGHRGQGVGRALLGETVRRLPRRHIGLYGNLDETRLDSIRWYRRQGFYINPSSGLTMSERVKPLDRDAMGITAVPGEVVFRGYRSILRDHLNDKADSRWEDRTATAEYRWQIALRSRVSPFSPALGYRLYTRRIAEDSAAEACHHAGMGPRPMFVFGWDPDRVRVCNECMPLHLERIRQYDADANCDGCGIEHSDTRLSWAGDEDRLLLVSAGLCPSCRSGEY
ncbi:GNAT family N-acetyltransferase [Mycobacterium intracellulare subsp. chimaera]|uniref:GNAT family N-acetyltransferase n=1 Tax=Mycobacterium intracellulare TaxID=1767 RepID=UPI00259394A3|nr:GNAT family N-acetyltransferase [Mycobacterium intracellulare]MDM3904300.1 GNAT family N-acetyltransferase [Mycobacterium intracellulare subsp. chimaera]